MTILNMVGGGGASGPKYGFIDLLVVGGGGGGGSPGSSYCYSAGGGGAGGFLENMCYPLNSECDNNIPVVIGSGGAKNANGGNSCFLSIIAYGGGRGACNSSGLNGGSGGGAASCGKNTIAGSVNGGSGCTGQGNAGGATCCYCSCGGGGGGGAGAAGGIPSGEKGGQGGCGKCSCISGDCVWYSGGGGGGSHNATVPNNGGCGGGGGGGTNAVDGCNADYYGGGGGGGGLNKCGGAGCQGIVILRYHTNGSDGLLPTSFGGCKYTCGDYTIHCFTTNDTFIPVYK